MNTGESQGAVKKASAHIVKAQEVLDILQTDDCNTDAAAVAVFTGSAAHSLMAIALLLQQIVDGDHD